MAVMVTTNKNMKTIPITIIRLSMMLALMVATATTRMGVNDDK